MVRGAAVRWLGFCKPKENYIFSKNVVRIFVCALCVESRTTIKEKIIELYTSVYIVHGCGTFNNLYDFAENFQ